MGCPERAQVEAALGRLIQDTGADRPLEVEARITGRAASWQVQLSGAGGQRTLTGTSCRSVSEAAVVVIALMVDPLAVTDAPPVFEEPARPIPFSVGVWALVDTHALPRPTPGTGLLASLGVGASFHLELQGQVFLRQLTTETEAPGASLLLFTGALGARRDFEWGPFSLSPLLAVEAGALRAVSFGVTNPASSLALWVAPRAGAMAALTFGVFRIGLRAEAAVPLTRPRFVVENVGPLHTPAFITLRGALTLELTFPPRSTSSAGN